MSDDKISVEISEINSNRRMVAILNIEDEETKALIKEITYQIHRELSYQFDSLHSRINMLENENSALRKLGEGLGAGLNDKKY